MVSGICEWVINFLLQTPMPKYGKFTWQPNTKDTKSHIMGKQEQKILSVLKSAGYAVTTVEVSEKIGNTVDNTSRALRGLRANNIVENGLTEYVNNRAVLTWQLVDKDLVINKKPETVRCRAFETIEETKVETPKESKFFDAELKQAIKIVLELIIKKL